ncbi:uncharacterized protein IWZ02DRAFT_437627 [Phyllosticta citriasiana]|uniref:uncharacterized protein n=1 Tax=Phyllosticta citriasiana TaxID=595635 RepID=UPI0030FD881E
MRSIFTITTIVAAVTQAYAQTSISTTLTIAPCLVTQTPENDIVSRTEPMGPKTPCPTLYVVKSNGTVTMSPGGQGPRPGMPSVAVTPSGASSNYAASTATPLPSSFEGAASKDAALGGGMIIVFGMAALLL